MRWLFVVVLLNFRGSKSVAEFKDVGKVLDQLVSVKWPRPTKCR